MWWIEWGRGLSSARELPRACEASSPRTRDGSGRTHRRFASFSIGAWLRQTLLWAHWDFEMEVSSTSFFNSEAVREGSRAGVAGASQLK